MKIEFTPEMLAVKAITDIAIMLLSNVVDTSKIGDKSVYDLDKSREKLLKKSTIDSLIGIGTKFSGTIHLYAEFPNSFLDESVPETFKHSKKTGEDGEVIGTRSWRKQSIITEGKNGTSLIQFVNKIGNNGDPKGMSHEEVILYAETFTNFLTYEEMLAWVELNTDTIIDG